METIEELEEERRLFYVAVSRAKENLFVTMPSYLHSWDAVFTRPSRFLAEVDRGKYEIK
jgi:DNA helicase II / ATP-dependent DNA helicase PcrA